MPVWRAMILAGFLVTGLAASRHMSPAFAGQASARAHQSSLRSRPIKLTITHEGVYRLTGAYLQSKGISIDTVAPVALGLSDGGVPVPIYVSSAGSTFDPSDFIEFYAHPVNNTYTSANVYVLADNVRRPARVRVAPIQPAKSLTAVAFGDFRDLNRNDRWTVAPVHDAYTTSNAWPSDGDPHWYAASLVVGADAGLSPTVSRVISFPLYGLSDSSPGPCSLVLPVWATAERGKGVVFQHELTVAITGHRGVVRPLPGSPFHWNGRGLAHTTGYTVRTTFPCTWLTNNTNNAGLNHLTVGTTVQGRTSVEQVVVRGVQVSFPRRLCAQDTNPRPASQSTPLSVEFENVPLYRGRAHPTLPIAFTVSGFSAPPQTVWRLTNGVATMLVGFGVVIGSGQPGLCPGGRYHISFGDTATATSRYFVTAAPLLPAAIAPLDLTAITAGAASSARYLIITHPNFASGLTPLVRYRQHQGFTVKVVKVSTIYDQFGHGQVNPEAIRAYITYAHDHLGTQYVLLVGGDTYDYHNYYGCPVSGACAPSNARNQSFIPSLYTNSPHGGIAAVDTLFAVHTVGARAIDLKRPWPDVAIGRLPVTTQDQLHTEVTKSTHWAGWVSRYRHTALYASGPSAIDGAASALMVPPGFHPNRYQETGASAHDLALHAALLAAVNRGREIANYVGEGSALQWGRPALLTSQDIAGLTNFSRPSLVFQWSTGTTDYANPAIPNIDSALLAATGAGARPTGAVLTLGAAGGGADPVDARLAGIAPGQTPFRLTAPDGMQGFYDYLAAGYSVGVSLQLAKQDLLAMSTDPSTVYTSAVYQILGDPALSLAGAPHSRLLHPMDPQIIRFAASASQQNVALSWAVAAPPSGTAYRLLRANAQGVYQPLGPGTRHVAQYLDRSGRAGARYQLQLLGANHQVVVRAFVQAH